MNRDEFYAAMARHDDARLRKILWTVYWRGNVQLRERIEDELRPQDQPKVKPKKELPDPAGVLDEVTTFVELAKDGAYMAGDRRVHHTERSRWRHTFRRLAADALAALTASDPVPAQQAVAKIVDLACDMKRYDYFHSDDPVEAAKFVVSEAVAALWESVLRHGGFAALAGRAPEQLIRWEADYGWTRRGYGQVAEKETLLAVPLARLLTTPDMWRTFAESYLEALEAAGRADPKRPRTVPDLAQDRRGHQQRAFRMPQEAQACLVGVILNVARSQQDASIAQQHLSGRVQRRGSLPRVRPGPDRPQMRRRRAGLFPGPDPRPHARGSLRELAAVRPPVAGPPNGAAPHASRSCIQCRPGGPDGRRAQCHGLAAPPVSFLPDQAGSSHPPIAYRVARLPVSPGQAAQDAQRRGQARYRIETFIACAPGGLSLTWSEIIFSDAPTVLDILRPREVRDALLTR